MTDPETALEPVPEIDAVKAQLEAAEQKAAENWDKCLRATAELENVRRRVERDAANLRKYALENVLADLIQVNDSLELGLKAAGPDAHGLQLIHKQFWAVLERYGVSAIDPAGQPFNPELHQAVTLQESAEAPANQVLEVMQKGYRLHDRLLRPAMVVVAKSTPVQP
jgi:molecular chaperone GrpE